MVSDGKDSNIKAFIYDMGGVVMKYADERIVDAVQSSESVFGDRLEDLETGKISLSEFFEIPGESDILKQKFEKLQITGGDNKDFDSLFTKFMIRDENIEKSIKILKENGYKIALLTNNFFYDKMKSKSTINNDLKDFDVVVESCRVEMRKPNADIYEHTLSLLNIQPNEAVFLDDLEINCKGAEKVGLKAIQVTANRSEEAVKEIERLTGLSII
uniref:Bifunctional epoxide hydrolase 2 (inferred by orthology to a human protein) n=1 Tax=Strongyloides venezuelensis TaxID=75913 RepID=A0A0K0FEK2_STRVS